MPNRRVYVTRVACFVFHTYMSRTVTLHGAILIRALRAFQPHRGDHNSNSRWQRLVGPKKGKAIEAPDKTGPPMFERQRIDKVLLVSSVDGKNPIFLDFDHTLFGCNSTELFIASCKPAILVAIIDFIVRRCVPWRLTGVANWFRLRDHCCLVIILALFPWNLFTWRRLAPEFFNKYVSPDISEALDKIDPSQITVVTFGMGVIVRPLLQRSKWRMSRVIATPIMAMPNYLVRGKLPMVLRSFDANIVSSSTFITDSLEDSDLLDAALLGILVKPQGDLYQAAEHLYLPLRYTFRAKYPFSYAFDQIFLVEMLLAIVCTAKDPSDLFAEFLFVPILIVSLMCIYEIGYFENDTVAAKFEAKPTLGKDVGRFRFYPIEPSAWIWAASLGAFGIAVAWYTGFVSYAKLGATVLAWFGALASLRLLFYVYNKPPVANRLLVYPVLQFMKFTPIFLVVTPTLVGAMLILCQIVTMWVLYLTYRAAGNRKKTVEKEVFRTILFSIALCLSAMSSTVDQLGGWFPVIAIASWSLARLVKAPILRMLRARDQLLA